MLNKYYKIKKSDLGTGDVVQTKDGQNFIVLLNTGFNNKHNVDMLFDPLNNYYRELNDYDDDLNYIYSNNKEINKLDICKVYISVDCPIVLWDIYKGDNPLWTYERIYINREHYRWKKS